MNKMNDSNKPYLNRNLICKNLLDFEKWIITFVHLFIGHYVLKNKEYSIGDKIEKAVIPDIKIEYTIRDIDRELTPGKHFLFII